MTRDDIIRMAREAGWQTGATSDDCMECSRFSLERFAALVAARTLEGSYDEMIALVRASEREKVARWQIGSGYTTGHGETIEDLLVELEWQVRESEREACAKVCEEPGWNAANWCAKQIRARGEKK